MQGADQKQGVGRFVTGSNPPTIAAIPDLYVRAGTPYALNLTFYVSDPDTPRAALAVWDSDPANVTAVPGAYPDLNVTYATVGTYFVTLWVSDGTDTAWTIVRIVVTLANTPPNQSAALPAATFDEDTIDANVLGGPATAYFMDPDGDALVFTVLDGNRVSARVNPNATIDLWAAANWSGSEWLRVRATDPTGAFAEAAFHVVVRPVNDPPILLVAFATVTFDEDTTLINAFGGNATAHFFDVDGDVLALTVQGTGNVSARVNADGTIDLWAVANWSGSTTLRVRATDPSATFAEGTFLVIVRPANDPPIVLSAVPAVAFDEDTVDTNAFTGPATVHFFDVDGDALAITVLGGSQVSARVNGDRTVDFWAAANWSGTESLRVRATDPSGTWVEAPFVVTVRPVDDAPTLLPIAAVTMTAGETRTIDLAPLLSDIDTNLSQLVVTTDSPYVTVNGFVLTMAFPSDWSQARFTVSISDGTLAASQAVQVTILPPWWKSVYFLPVPPSLLAVVIGVFAQRSRWRPTKAFLVDERNEMIREFTLDRACDVTFEQVQQAGALDAVDKSVKVSKYHAQTVRGNALGLVLLAYGPVTVDQIEFAREMLVNIQDKFAAEKESVAAERAAFESRAVAVGEMHEAAAAAQVRTAEEARRAEELRAEVEARESRLGAENEAAATRAKELKEFEAALAGRTSEAEAHEAHARESIAKADARQKEIEQLREGLPEREASVLDREARVDEREETARAHMQSLAVDTKALLDAKEALAADRAALQESRKALEVETKELESRSARLMQDVHSRSKELEGQSKALQEVQNTLTDARESFEAMRHEKTAWIASKDIELEARQHTLDEKEGAVRGQAEANARQLADLAAREEAYEVEGDRLERARATLDARKSELDATAKTLEAKGADLRELEARKAEEYRSWESTLASQQTLLKEQKESTEAEFAEQRTALEARRQEMETREREVIEREAKARASVEWVMHAQDEVKARETAAANAMTAARDLQAASETARAENARQVEELETRERQLKAEIERRELALAKRAGSVEAEAAAWSDRQTAAERVLADRETELRHAESEAAARIDTFEQKALVMVTREDQLDTLRESLDREREDLN
ncbi:MAG: tandem-95 repeat protein, partial [Methanobacteriota archaeon]